ncbi:MAG: hypothetical protein V2I37_09770 [Marinilabiliaceae bacterium]|jgi:hypothetical protein|nr:hypothetical protein [Marinilabiliaceae bacterium]
MKKLSFYILITIVFIPFALSQGQATNTAVLCLKEQDFSAQQNMIYSPAFRASWTSLSQSVLKEAVLLKKPLALADDLNNAPYIPSDKSNWFIKSGFIEKGIIEEIKKETLSRFGIKAPGIDNMEGLKEGILNYALFRYRSRFEKPFEELEWDFISGGKTSRVKCFGVSTGNEESRAAIRKQVSIYDYLHRDDFIIRIEGSSDNYELILAKVPPGKNVAEIVAEIDERMSDSFPDHLGSSDELIIPKIIVSADHCFGELHRRFLANKGFEEYFIARAEQIVDFSLDQEGAEATVTGKLLLKKGPVPRIYAFDRPFFLLLRPRAAGNEPVLAMWIYDTEFLLDAG